MGFEYSVICDNWCYFWRILEVLPDILGGMLMVIGALKVIARWTKWKWDDNLLEILEKVLYPISLLVPFLQALRPKNERTIIQDRQETSSSGSPVKRAQRRPKSTKNKS